jgi:hypothetical protein
MRATEKACEQTERRQTVTDNRDEAGEESDVGLSSNRGDEDFVGSWIVSQ